MGRMIFLPQSDEHPLFWGLFIVGSIFGIIHFIDAMTGAGILQSFHLGIGPF